MSLGIVQRSVHAGVAPNFPSGMTELKGTRKVA